MTTSARQQENDTNMRVADNIRAELARQRWSGRKAATALGVNTNYVARRLSGETPLSPSDLEMFARLLGVHPGDFFGNEKTPPAPKSEGRNARLEGLEPPTFCSGVQPVISLDWYRNRQAS